MEDVARRAGVSLSTVSRALRDDVRIGVKTRQRVKAIATELHYRPNPMVAALMSQVRAAHPPEAQCNLAWLDLRTDPENLRVDPVMRDFFRGATTRAASASYSLERVVARREGMTPGRLQQILQSRGVCGLLLPHFEGSDGRTAAIPLDLGGFTVVTVGARFFEPDLDFATNDQYESGRLAVLELWKLGYRRIGYVGMPYSEAVVQNRFCAGYLTAMQVQLGAAPLPPLILTEDRLLAEWCRAERPEVVLSPAARVRELLGAAGWRVPGDIAFAHLHVAPDDAETTGICQNSVAVGAAAVDLLIGQLCSRDPGIPALAKGVLVPGRWMPGRTVPRR